MGSVAFAVDASTSHFINFDINNVAGMTVVAASPSGFVHTLVFPFNELTYCYLTKDLDPNLYKVIKATGVVTTIGSMGSANFLDMATDPTTGMIYGTDGSGLYTVNPATPSYTYLGSHATGGTFMIGLSSDVLGKLWGYDLGTDLFYSINKVTGVATTIGSIGFNANYGQSMFYDQITNKPIMASFNSGSFMAEIRAVDVTTGGSVILSSTADQISGADIPNTWIDLTPGGIVGYNVYRDYWVHHLFIH